jgi:hypothetical protein
MAETVQYVLEGMLPELEELERKGLFSRAEVRKIVAKRQDFEYQLKRRAALKEDFYRRAGQPGGPGGRVSGGGDAQSRPYRRRAWCEAANRPPEHSSHATLTHYAAGT